METYDSPHPVTAAIRSRVAEYCIRLGLAPVLADDSSEHSQTSLASDFVVDRDIPATFGPLLKGLEMYEANDADAKKGVWRGAIDWLWLDGINLKDSRINEILNIFGCQPEIAKKSFNSFSEPSLTFPFTEGLSIVVSEWSDADEPFSGRGKTSGAKLTFRLPTQPIDEAAHATRREERMAQFEARLREGTLPAKFVEAVGEETLKKLFG